MHAMFKELIKSAKKKENFRDRVNLHDSPDDILQEMIICLFKKSYIRMHRHPKDEIYHLIKGKLIVILSEDGYDFYTIILNEHNPIVRIKAGVYHQPIATTKYVIYHEIYQGPYDKYKDIEYYGNSLLSTL